MLLDFKQAKDRSEAARQTGFREQIQALGMYFELTLDHKFNLCCASFKAFSLYTAPEGRYRLTVSLFIHQIGNAGPVSTLKAITHKQHTERILCYLITDPHTNPSAIKTQTCRMCFAYFLTTYPFGAMPLGCSIILRWALVSHATRALFCGQLSSGCHRTALVPESMHLTGGKVGQPGQIIPKMDFVPLIPTCWRPFCSDHSPLSPAVQGVFSAT